MAASPPILTLQNIALSFGGTPLLEDANLIINSGERLCVVGRNGSGKSTLLKIAAGQVEQDSGTRFIQPGTTVRYLPQEPDLSAFDNVMDYVMAGLAPGDTPYRAEYLLAELGLDGTEAPDALSGGQARRAALARTLAPEPDILMLDEPTNHLDLPAIEWLEKELRSLRSAIILISHDRRFLENLSRRTLWVDRGETRTMEQGFAHFEGWRDAYLEQEELDQHKLARKIVREEHWITYGVTARRKRNVKRLGDLAGLRAQKKSHRKAQGGVNITLSEGETSGKMVAKIKKISKRFESKRIVDDFSMLISRGDRIGIVGPNGSGKTTLVKLITGELEPDAGTVKLGSNLTMVVMDQNRMSLDPNWTVKDALTDGSGDMVEVGDGHKHVISYMKDFLFSPEQVRTPLRALSGGERGRLLIARGMRLPSNFLILDEPTNDLDLETLDLLQEMLTDYEGTVILVSHDRDFLDRTVSSVLSVDDDGLFREYAGGYSDMIVQRNLSVQKRDDAATPASDVRAEKKAKPNTPPQSTSSQGGKKLSFKHKHALEVLPKEMDKIRTEIVACQKILAEPELFTKKPDTFSAEADRLAKLEESLAQKEESWLELEIMREEIDG